MNRRRGDRSFVPSPEFVTHEREVKEAIDRLQNVTDDLTRLLDEDKPDDE